MIQLLRSKPTPSLIKKKIQTTYNKYSFSHIGVFAPMEKSVHLFVGLNEETCKDAKDFILTITDINNRSIRLAADTEKFQKEKLLFSHLLDHSLHQAPIRVEIFQKKETEDFENFSFDIWYMQKESKDLRQGLLSRLGNYFPGPNKN